MGKIKVGTVFTSNSYGDYCTTKDQGIYKVSIKFLTTGWQDTVTRSAALEGKVKDYLYPSVFGKGYNSLGRSRGISNNPKLKRARNLWNKMLERCYSEDKQSTNPTYKGCYVSEDWLDFANYWKWYDKVCDTPIKSTYHVDKDLISEGNKLYSEATCFLVPRALNNILPSKSRNKDTSLPVGIHLLKETGRYQAYCNNVKGTRVSLGTFTTVKSAYNVYVQYKKEVINLKVEEYKELIDPRLVEILKNYKFDKEYYNV